jgi:serine/threonine protein kinase
MAKEDFRRSPSDPLGQNFGPYKLVRRLGAGGMAETFEAIRRGPSGFSQRVCLKLVLPFLRDSKDFIQLFEREARLAAKLRHSNIVGVIDFGVIDGVSYMALELVDGADLRAVLDAQPGKQLAHDVVALLGHELAAALDHAHNPPVCVDAPDSDANAIIHRDISPSNVLVSRHGEILLTDFGVAKAVSDASDQQSAVKGKIPYMSPEQLRAQRLDGRADLFALGVVLFEALGGQRPYDGEHDPATIMFILEGDHPQLRSLAPDAPEDLCRVIESLIKADRDERPESAAVLAELLDEFVPPPRVRRQLGKMATETRAQGAAPISEERVAVEGSTGVQSESDRDTIPEGSGSTPRSSRKLVSWMAASMFVISAVVGLTIVSWPVAEPAPKQEPAPAASLEESHTPPSPAVDETPRDATETDAQPSESPSVRKAQPAVTAPRPARLTVVVFPWGNVWVNGKHMGQAPLEDEELKSGRYEIGAGQGSPTRTRTVRLRAGQRKTVSFELAQ